MRGETQGISNKPASKKDNKNLLQRLKPNKLRQTEILVKVVILISFLIDNNFSTY